MDKGAKIGIFGAGTIALIGAGILWYKFKSAADSTKSISVRLSELKNLRQGPGELTFQCDLLISNPSLVDLKIGIRSIKIKHKGSDILNTKPSTEIFEIPAGSEKTISGITFRFPWQNIAKLLGLGSLWDTVKEKASTLVSGDLESKIKENFTVLLLMTVNGVSMTIEQGFGEETHKDIESGDTVGRLELSAGPRSVKDGTKYNYLFPKADNRETVVVKNGSVKETVGQMLENVKKYHRQVKKLAPILKGATLEETCRNIFSFCYTYLQYRNDTAGKEELRTPARSWNDGQVMHRQMGVKQSGIDCDDFSVFVASLLTCLGITDWVFRVTEYENRGYWQHVYIALPDGRGGEIIIDPVLDRNNYQKKYSKKMDFASGLKGLDIAVLSGIEGQTAAEKLLNFEEAESIRGLGALSDKEAAESLKKRLILLRQSAVESPEMFRREYGAPAHFIKLADHVITNFHIDPVRALEDAAKYEDMLYMQGQVKGTGGLDDELDDGDFADAVASGGTVASIGSLQAHLAAEMADSVYGVIETENGLIAERHAVAGLAGTGGSAYVQVLESLEGRIERKARRAKRKAARKAKRAERKAEGKGFFRKVAKGIKKGVKTAVKIVKKINPVGVTYRNAMLLKFRSNFNGTSERLAIGYLSKDKASQYLENMNDYGVIRYEIAKLEKKFSNWGGNPKNLRRAITTGARKKAGMDVHGMDGLGAVPAIIATIFSGLLKVFKKIKFKKTANDASDADLSVNTPASDTDLSVNTPASSERKVKGKPAAQVYSSPVTPPPPSPSALTLSQKIASVMKSKTTWITIGTLGVAAAVSYIAFRPKNDNTPKKQIRQLNGARFR